MAGGTQGKRRALAACAIALATLALAGGLVSAAPIVPDPEEPAERMALRLHDLPPGYLTFGLGAEGANDRFLCEELEPADPGKQLARWVDRYKPRGCVDAYYKLYRVPGPGPAPPLVGTGALETGSLAAAEAGLALSPQLLAKLTNDAPYEPKPLEEVEPTASVGDGTRLFHWRGVPSFLYAGRVGSFLVWRSGTALGAVFTTGSSLASTGRAALELARRQQIHMAAPSPYTEAERDTVEVSLDNPESKFPVHWLGRTFRPGHGLPPTELVEAFGPYPARNRSSDHDPRARLNYKRDLALYLWDLQGWKRFSRSDRGREELSSPCASSQPMPLPKGRAVIFTTHRSLFAGCRKRGPARYFAVAFLGRTVVAVNLQGCERCFLVDDGPYDSLRAMKVIVRGLTLRTKPVY